MKFNISAMTIEAKEGVFEGNVKIFVHDREELDDLCKQLLKLPGIERVDRFDAEWEQKSEDRSQKIEYKLNHN